MAGSALGAEKAAAKRLGMTHKEYSARVAAGEKWCGSCRGWHLRGRFGSDANRSDGLASTCLDVRASRSANRPGTRQRRLSAAFGLAWCRGCEDWLPMDEITQGACRKHHNEYGRAYYASNRAEQCGLRTARTRRIGPIPGWWRTQAFAEFGGRCAYGCDREATALDHVFPVSRGGKSRPSNLVPACKPCNSRKHARWPVPWLESGYASFPDQWEQVTCLDLVHGGPLDDLFDHGSWEEWEQQFPEDLRIREFPAEPATVGGAR